MPKTAWEHTCRRGSVTHGQERRGCLAVSLRVEPRQEECMANFNKVLLLGYLTRDPVVRYTPAGTAVATFGLATNHRYRQGDETKEEVCFVDVTVFGRQADTISVYLHKGSPALIEGRLRWRSWETNDGQRRSKHEVVADAVHFLPRRDDHAADADEGSFGDDADMPFVQFGGKKSAQDLDEDIPF